MKSLSELFLSGGNVVPLIEGGKGIGASDGHSAGAWARCGGVGTFSGVCPRRYDDQGNVIPIQYKGQTRSDRHKEYIDMSVEGSLQQARIAHDVSSKRGRINMNVLWEMGGVEQILHGVLSRHQGLIHGITCGAGMPYKLAEIAAAYKVYYHPIVSSGRAFAALWRRSYSRVREWLSSVVYEDPWRAGGHNGLSRREDPQAPEDPYPRVLELRRVMNSAGLHNVPIVMAGGFWCLREWQDWIDSKELGPVAFQFGTRPLLTEESPIPLIWKKKLLTTKQKDVFLNRFSPTGFYSSALKNPFLQELEERSLRQVAFVKEPQEGFVPFSFGARGRVVYVAKEDEVRLREWCNQGYSEALKTPDQTFVFVTPEKRMQILEDQRACMGCLSGCLFSNWSQEFGTTGMLPDPRSYCIQKTLLASIAGKSVEDELIFAGTNVYRFGEDPLYEKGIPTVQKLFDTLLLGD